jgi:hypothetical protein
MGNHPRRGLRAVLAGSLALGSVLVGSVVVGTMPASAATPVSLYVVIGGSGTGDCSSLANACSSIQTAINTAQGGSFNGDDVTINVAAGTYTENDSVNASLLNSLTIAGAVASSTTVNGNQAGTVITIDSGTVTISGLTITNGNGANGGGISNETATLYVTDDTISGNSANGNGGGIENGDHGYTGTVTVTDSTFANNSANYGNGFGDGGAIVNGDENSTGTLAVTDSTFVNNSASSLGDGGAIDNGDGGGTGTLTVTDSTFTGNSAGIYGATIDSGGYGGGGSTSVAADIFVGSCAYWDGTGPHDAGYNLGTDGSCYSGGTGDVTDPGLTLPGLADNGGPTETILPEPGSPAIGVIPSLPSTTLNGVQVCPRTDQRGIASAGSCTIGAVEIPSPLSITKFTPSSGPVGTVVTIKGTNLSGATKATFNGVKGTITSDTATKLKVKVPSGATTGKIKVVTPGGKATTITAFTVT